MFDHKHTASRATPNMIALSLAVLWAGACERAEVAPGAPGSPQPTATINPNTETRRPRSSPGAPGALPSSKLALPVSFPQELRVDDESVNAFVERALVGIASGEYEPYRLLWSIKDEPLSRGDYERRWHGVTDIELRALRRIILTTGKASLLDGKSSLLDGNGRPTGDASYALLADFSFGLPDRADLPTPARRGLRDSKASLLADAPAQREPLLGVVWIVVKEQDNWRLAKPPKAVKRWLREQVAASDEQTASNTESSP